jgi:hypothetical protein
METHSEMYQYCYLEVLKHIIEKVPNLILKLIEFQHKVSYQWLPEMKNYFPPSNLSSLVEKTTSLFSEPFVMFTEVYHKHGDDKYNYRVCLAVTEE